LILGEDGRKLAKRAPGATVASLRETGIPAEAARAYLDELDLPRHDVHLDLARIRRLSIDALETLARFRELVEGGLEPKAIVRELKAVGGDLKALRVALTGQERGPELA